MSGNPLIDIEDKKTWTDFGRQGFLILQGAKLEGATETEATNLVVAFYAGMFQGVMNFKEDDNEHNN